MLGLKTRAKIAFDAMRYAGKAMKASAVVVTDWGIEHYRNGKCVDRFNVHNLITTEGLDAWNNIMFHGATQIATWYVILFSTDTTILATHTYAVPGFTEVTTEVDEATRVAFNEAESSGGVITNTANKALYTFNTNVTIYGAGLVGGGAAATTKGDTAGGGTLFAAAKFSTPKAMSDDEILAITVTDTLANA